MKSREISELLATPLEYTKTIGFRLNEKRLDKFLQGRIESFKNAVDEFNGEIFIDSCGKLLEIAKNSLFWKDDKGNYHGNKKVKIKYRWLRARFKYDYEEYTRKKSISELKKDKVYDVSVFEDFLLQWFDEQKRTLEDIDKLLKLPEESREGKAEIALLIGKLSRKDGLNILRELFTGNVKLPGDTPEKEQNIRDNFIPQVLKQLDSAVNAFLPSQSRGIRVVGASLNYYTVNKQRKEYWNDEIQRAKEELNEHYHGSIDDKFANKIGLNEYIDDILPGKTFDTLTLDDAYSIKKQFYSSEKKRFTEAIDSGALKINDVHTTKFPLFACQKDAFEEYVRLTHEIQQNATKKNKLQKTDPQHHKLKVEIDKLKKKRGVFFQKKCEKLLSLNDYHKKVALKRGQIIARIKGYEKEGNEYNMTGHWALLVERCDNKEIKRQVLLIPREKMTDARNYINKLPTTKGKENISLVEFRSLTLRALEKLCFKTVGNTFVKELEKEKFRTKKRYELNNSAEFISYYKQVLRTEYAKKEIARYEGMNTMLDADYATLDDFESALKKVCYIKTYHVITDEELNKFLEEYDVALFSITSYDLERKPPRLKAHTDIWNQFWSKENESKCFEVRLNPQFSIFWRKALREASRYHNRYSQSQYTLHMTVTQNALEPAMKFPFGNKKFIIDSIDEYNKKINISIAKNKNNLFYYGIDRGQAELATLCVTSFPEEKQYIAKDVAGREMNHPMPDFPKFEVWSLKEKCYTEKDEKGRIVYKNISYFLDNEDMFEKRKTSCIDLTTAKLIKGKIVLNGDIATYMRLKEIAAKRRLFTLFANKRIPEKEQVQYDDKEDIFYIKTFIENATLQKISWFRKEFESIRSKEDFFDILKNYLTRLRSGAHKDEVESIEMINHLRDAVTANMIGIIACLYQRYPGIIVLENLGHEDIKRHFEEQSNENISRRLEWALYRRFQTMGLMPPQVPQSVLLRGEFSEAQFGVIRFINKENTSSTCPRCGISDRGNKNEKLKGIFSCSNKNCLFNTTDNLLEFDGLDNCDKVAAFNIAKRGFK